MITLLISKLFFNNNGTGYIEDILLYFSNPILVLASQVEVLLQLSFLFFIHVIMMLILSEDEGFFEIANLLLVFLLFLFSFMKAPVLCFQLF